MNRSWTWLVISPLAALLLLTGCADEPTDARTAVRNATFDELFEEVARIEFEEPFEDVITRINDIEAASDGRIVLVDPGQSKVRVYSPTGRLLRSFGRNGDGPGEYRSVADAAFAEDGSLFVADFAPPRVQRYTPELELDTTFRVEDAEAIHDLYALGDRLLLRLVRRIPRAYKYEWYSQDGQRLVRFHREHPLVSEIPYWRSATREIAAVGGGNVFVADQILYPIYRYTLAGELVDSFGIRPRSWVQASRLRVGQFSNPRRDRLSFEQWMRTFTSMSRLAVYGDSLLLVSHERLDPEELAYREGIYSLDIYTLDGRKLYEDVALPGEMMVKGRDHVYLLLSTPPGPWTMGKYRLRTAEAD